MYPRSYIKIMMNIVMKYQKNWAQISSKGNVRLKNTAMLFDKSSNKCQWKKQPSLVISAQIWHISEVFADADLGFKTHLTPALLTYFY